MHRVQITLGLNCPMQHCQHKLIKLIMWGSGGRARVGGWWDCHYDSELFRGLNPHYVTWRFYYLPQGLCMYISTTNRKSDHQRLRKHKQYLLGIATVFLLKVIQIHIMCCARTRCGVWICTKYTFNEHVYISINQLFQQALALENVHRNIILCTYHVPHLASMIHCTMGWLFSMEELQVLFDYI